MSIITTNTYAQTQLIKNVSVEQFQEFAKGNDGTVLDVRTAKEFVNGHIEGAQNVVYSMFGFEDAVKVLDKSKTYYIYCKSGARSGRALNILKKQGFVKVYNLSGGILAWQRKGLSVVK